MNIRYQLRFFFALTLLLLFSISLYTNYLHRKNFDHTNHLLTELRKTLPISYSVQLHLQAERTAWKNVLLRGTEADKYHDYLSTFFAEEREVRKGITQLLTTFSEDSEIHALLLNLDQSHRALGRVLRYAINTFNDTVENPHLVADTIAGAMEVSPDLLIKQIAQRIEQDHQQQVAALNKVLRKKEISIVIVFLAIGLIAALIFIWLIDRQIGKPAEQAAFLANYDPLTGLPNRTLFQDRLQHAMDQADRNLNQVALLFFDLDHFKTINDVFGHHAGDELLRQAGERLRNSIRKSDTPARLGGDEFGVILEGLSGASDASNVAEHIREAMQRPFEIMGQESHISASIGITLYPNDGTSSETLLKNADAAMYLAKERGRNTYHCFTSDLNQAAADRLAMDTLLRNAVKLNQFSIHYQPQVELDSARILGAEALLRLKTNEETIPQAEFIRGMKESGLIVPVGTWVLQQACHQAAEWQSLNRGEFRMTVNLSSRQLRAPSLVKQVQQALTDSGLAPHCLVLEISEYDLIDGHKGNDILQQIEALGVHLAIDGFGTGYFSLTDLKRLCVGVLKINCSLIREITHDRDAAAITSAIIALGHKLGIEVIAEGVENEGQLAFLKDQGCNHIQGYLVSRPVAAEDFRQWLLDTQGRELLSPS